MKLSKTTKILKKADRYKDYILNEIEFFKIYYKKDLIYNNIKKWHKYGSQATNDNCIDKNRWSFYRGQSIDNHMLAKSDVSPLVNLIYCLLENYKEKFIADYSKLRNQIEHHGGIYHVEDETILRLALWSAPYANDENERLSPFGYLFSSVGESLRHQEIGILDALGQQLWDSSLDDPNGDEESESIVKVDLVRAQLLLAVVYKNFSDFLDREVSEDYIVKYDLFESVLGFWEQIRQKRYQYEKDENLLKKEWYKYNIDHFEANLYEIETNKIGINKYINRLALDLSKLKKNNHSTEVENEKALIDYNNLLTNLESFINSKYIRLSKDKERTILDLFKSLPSEILKELYKDLYRVTFLKEDYKYLPLVQHINGSASAWATDRVVPTILVINKKRATDNKVDRRIEAYAALPHEVGHDILDTFTNDVLLDCYKHEIKKSRLIKMKLMWEAWINEIFADAAGVCLLGIHSIRGLMAALEELGAPLDLIRKVENTDSYDTHPAPLIRVMITFRIYEEFLKGLAKKEMGYSSRNKKSQSPINQIPGDIYEKIKFWIKNQPQKDIKFDKSSNNNIVETILKEAKIFDEVQNSLIKWPQVIKEIDAIVDILFTKQDCLKNRSIFDLYSEILSDPVFRGLADGFDKKEEHIAFEKRCMKQIEESLV